MEGSKKAWQRHEELFTAIYRQTDTWLYINTFIYISIYMERGFNTRITL